MATEPGPFQDSGNLEDIKAQDFGSLVLRVEKVGVWQRSGPGASGQCIKPELNFALYQVRLRINVADPPSLNGLHWDIWRRFSEFAELHAEFGKPKLQVKFPPKTLWRKLSDEFLEERRALLDQYLQSLSGEPNRRDNECFRQFIYPRSRAAGERPAPTSIDNGNHSVDTDAPAPIGPSDKLSEEHKPGSSATDKTPMSSAATDETVSDTRFFEARVDIAPSSPGPAADPTCTKSDPTSTHHPGLPCHHSPTLKPIPTRLTRTTPQRAPVILMSVCTQVRSAWDVGTPVDVYSNSSRLWRSGKILSIGKTSGFPRPAQEDALTVAYGEKNRCRKVLPRSSLELRAAGSSQIMGAPAFAGRGPPEERVSVSPQSMKEVEATAHAWNQVVESSQTSEARRAQARPVLPDDQRIATSPSTDSPKSLLSPLDEARTSPSVEKARSLPSGPLRDNAGDDAEGAVSKRKPKEAAETAENQNKEQLFQSGDLVQFPNRLPSWSWDPMRRGIRSPRKIAATHPGRRRPGDPKLPKDAKAGVWRVSTEGPAAGSRWVDAERLRKQPKPIKVEGAQSPQGGQDSPAKAEMLENVLQTGSKTTVLASSMADVERGRTARRSAAPEPRAPSQPHTSRSKKTDTPPSRRKSTPLPSKRIVQPDKTRRKSLKPKWMRWIKGKLDKSNTEKQKKLSPTGEDFTVANQLNSLPSANKRGDSSTVSKKIQVLDKLRVDKSGGTARRAGPRTGKVKRVRMKGGWDKKVKLPDRLPPDHTVDVLDPNTQRRLSRIRHHLVIKARRHSPA